MRSGAVWRLFAFLAALLLATAGMASERDAALIVHYTFQEGAGTIIKDHSSNGIDGKIIGDLKWVKGSYGSALAFDGRNGYVDCGTDERLSSIGKVGTVSLWCLPKTLQGAFVAWNTGPYWADERLVIAVNTWLFEGRNVMLALADGAGCQSDFSPFGLVPVGEWTHLTLTFDGRTVHCYRNGILVKVMSQNVEPALKGVPLWLGRTRGLGREYYHGLLSDVRLYGRELTAPEILDDFKSNAPKRGVGRLRFSRPQVKVQVYPDAGKIHAEVDPRCLQPLPDGVGLAIELCSPGKDITLMRRDVPAILTALPTDVAFDAKALPPGEYTVRAVVRDTDGKTLRIEGAETLTGAKESFQYVYPNCYAHLLGRFDAKYRYWMNYHWRVFRVQKPTAKLSISDWSTDKEPSGPIGQELMYNFIEIQPYMAPAAASASPEILTVAESSDEYPRHSEASVVELSDGTLLMAWIEFMGKDGKGGDNTPARLAAMTSCDGGASWAQRRILVENEPGDINVFSPNLLFLPDGELLFVFFRYHVLDDNVIPSASCFVCRSRDEGKTFSPPRPLWTRKPWVHPSGVLRQLSSGRLLLPISRQVGRVWSASDHIVSGCMVSDDGGETWQEPSCWVDLPLRGVMEPHVVELRDGRVLMVMRTQLGAVFKSVSSDGGVTWSKPQTTGLKSPESCPEIIRLPGTGNLLLVWNNADYDPASSHFGRRTPLTVAVSKDDGETWEHIKDIETDPGCAYSNPGCCITSTGKVILTYWVSQYAPDGRFGGRLDLKAALFDVNWLYQPVEMHARPCTLQ